MGHKGKLVLMEKMEEKVTLVNKEKQVLKGTLDHPGLWGTREKMG